MELGGKGAATGRQRQRLWKTASFSPSPLSLLRKLPLPRLDLGRFQELHRKSPGMGDEMTRGGFGHLRKATSNWGIRDSRDTLGKTCPPSQLSLLTWLQEPWQPHLDLPGSLYRFFYEKSDQPKKQSSKSPDIKGYDETALPDHPRVKSKSISPIHTLRASNMRFRSQVLFTSSSQGYSNYLRKASNILRW